MTGTPIALSLIICTRNRAQALRRCLAGIRADEMCAVSGELVLVDNGSSDDTAAVASAFQRQSPFPVQVVKEPQPGLGRARNAGLAAARGETLVFTDDDCFLAEGYLLTASAIFRGATFQYCGGQIVLRNSADASYGCVTRREPQMYPPKSLIAPGEFQGANLVIQRSVLDRIGLFDPMLGPGTEFRCEDVDYCARASWAGFTGAYVPELVVEHDHGRKPGSAELLCLEHDNGIGRGAYYMKCILSGHVPPICQWGTLWRQLVRRGLRWAELSGACRYALVRVMQRFR